MLSKYRKKRNFKSTPEPPGASRSLSAKQLAFVVQKHDATNLHYDFRLELDGVLKSWAVPKGPSLNPDRKSLAVEVEDHPVEYGDFEGTIPKGQYGGGSVLLWDLGTWEPLEDPHKGLKNGKLHFTLHGQKLRGEWTLVRFHGEKNKRNWLLIKSRDSFAKKDSEIINDQPRSVKSNRLIEAIGNGKATAKSKKGDAIPTDIRPQLATWVSTPPDGDDWLHEVKFDGYRLIVGVDHGQASLITRGAQDWTHRFPQIAKALSNISGQAVLDGEVVALDKQGHSHFQSLQGSWKNGSSVDPVIYLFDLLYCNRKDLRNLPLIERKQQLKKLISALKNDRVKYADHVRGNGSAVVFAACKMALEGIVSKRADAHYVGGRTLTWLKSKCGYRQEFIIIGYTDPQGGRQEFGSLLMGYYNQNKELVYAGRVGTGFDASLLKKIKQQMKPHERPTPPTDVPPPARERRAAHWITPRLVAEVRFAGWTEDNLIRQGAFLGLREDKKAPQIIREDHGPQLTQRRSKSSAAAIPTQLKLTHPDRLIFPGTKITKEDLADYYQSVADRMLPHIIDRPLTLMRYPSGISGSSFIQRHFTDNLPTGIESMKDGKKEAYLMIRDAAGLRALVQMNAIEIHAWGCEPDKIERPDRLVFDLDPDESLPWKKIVGAATELKEILESVKLRPLVKTTGGKGLHIVVPILPTVDWDHAKAFSKSIAEEMARRNPKFYTTNLRKTERPGRIFIDYLRNGRSATSVAPYSVRARKDAPVSMPVDWDEIASLKGGNRFTVTNVHQRVEKKNNPWADFESNRRDLHKITSG
jgi:bifunctional non-homologous end joining protein LigD